MNDNFSERLKNYRIEQSKIRGFKVTQDVLSNELGIARSVIAEIERGTREPSKDVLIKLNKHSGLTLDFWLLGNNSPSKYLDIDKVIDLMIKDKLITSSEDIRKESVKEIMLNFLEKEIKWRLSNG